MISLCPLSGCLTKWKERVNTTYSIQNAVGAGYFNMTIYANNEAVAPLAQGVFYSDETSHRAGWAHYVLLEDNNVLFFITRVPNAEESRRIHQLENRLFFFARNVPSVAAQRIHLLASVNGAKPIDISGQVLDYAFNSGCYEDKAAPPDLGPLKIENDQLLIGLHSPTSGNLKTNKIIKIPLSIIFMWLGKSHGVGESHGVVPEWH